MSASYLRLGASAAIVAVLAFAGWRLYDLGKVHGVEELKSLRAERAMVDSRTAKLSGENKQLREQVAILEASAKIDRQAAEAIMGDIELLESALTAAREEVEFYRGIVKPDELQAGLRIHHFELEAGNSDTEFHYDLVLTQLKRHDRAVSGVVDLRVIGSLHGESGELALAGITQPSVKQLKFRFRYFQDLTGTIILPEDFVPESVVLDVKPEGKGKLKPVSKRFDWLASGP